jgi:hypothetical protein
MGSEQTEVQFGPSYSGHMSTPLRRLWTILLPLISSPVSMSSVHSAFGASRGCSSVVGLLISTSPDLISNFCTVCDLVMAAAKNQMRFEGSAKSSRESQDCIVAMFRMTRGSLEGQYIRSYSHVCLRVQLSKIAHSTNRSSLPLSFSFSYTSPIPLLST